MKKILFKDVLPKNALPAKEACVVKLEGAKEEIHFNHLNIDVLDAIIQKMAMDYCSSRAVYSELGGVAHFESLLFVSMTSISVEDGENTLINTGTAWEILKSNGLIGEMNKAIAMMHDFSLEELYGYFKSTCLAMFEERRSIGATVASLIEVLKEIDFSKINVGETLKALKIDPEAVLSAVTNDVDKEAVKAALNLKEQG